MKVEIEKVQDKAGWEVKLGTSAVSFRSHEEAEDFAKRLQTRLDAPHSLLTSCGEMLAELSFPVRTS